ncbi:MAG: TetR/AcrR family transcriptional regulator [Mariprofundus sp.]
MTDQARALILDKARQRFAHYGLKKTSMSEIASDCDMSVGNLYRFFKNKEAIAMAGAQACMLEKAERSEALAAQQTDAWQKLNRFLLERLRYMHAFVCDTPHLYEMVEFVMTRSSDVLQFYEERAVDQIRQFLEEGMAAGEFRQADSLQLAKSIYMAMFRFNMPLCMSAPLHQLEQEQGELLDLIHTGLGGSK